MPRPSLLFVDDEPRIVRSLKILFRQGYEVFTATDGRQALEILQEKRINVMVCDQRMPGITGVKLFQRVKRMSPNTMRILLTGYSDLEAVKGSINEGEVFRYVNKPWMNNEIRETVQNAAVVSQRMYSQPVAAPRKRGRADILLLDDVLGVSLMIREMLKDKYNVHMARGLENALELLGTFPIGVVVADIRPNNGNNVPFLKILKREFPLAVSIAVTDQGDAESAIGLINQGQVFRYLDQLNKEDLTRMITSAVDYHYHLRTRPVELDRHQVEKSREEDRLVTNFREKLQGIRATMRRMQAV